MFPSLLKRKFVIIVILVLIVTIKVFNIDRLFQYDPPKVEWAEQSSKTALSQRHRNLTIVSAYFNLGTFSKGNILGRLFNKPFSTTRYGEWGSVFSRIQNPVIFYTDSLELKHLMVDARKDLPGSTEIVFISDRSSLWSFSISGRIKEIYDDPNYPKYHPNTVIADYPCVQHAKYEVVADAIKRKRFSAEYYAWLDVGYFRDMVGAVDDFILEVPSDFDDSKVAMNRVEDQSLQKSPSEVMKNNFVWVGGGLFLGRPQTLIVLSEDYKKAVLTLLKQKLMNTDQQILYSMYTEKGHKEIQPKTQLQLYYSTDTSGSLILPGENPWFHLGYLCLKRILRRTM